MLDTSARQFTIYTEDMSRRVRSQLERARLFELINRYFDGATINYGDGLWKGTIEGSATITILARACDLQTVVNLAGDIKHVFRQQSVIVTSQPVTRIGV